MRFSSSSASETLLASKSQYHRHRSGRIEPTGDGLRFSQSPSVTGKLPRKFFARILESPSRICVSDACLPRARSGNSKPRNNNLKIIFVIPTVSFLDLSSLYPVYINQTKSNYMV
ncbi:hypothetical protein Bca52824_026534 [Brassica carinata]|uniref:Uncharacterized protein n=1 Tax=Brassica carinata TaxID=52824 RepID=A0A8X7VAB1_BRACI|nr:hypothetical protein Bca52824_026534 [Brassica carinata]